MKQIKTIALMIAAVVFFIFSIWFFQRYIFQPKAAVEKASISYSPARISADKNSQFNIGIVISAAPGKKISGIDLVIDYGVFGQEAIDFIDFNQIPENYFDRTIINQDVSIEGRKRRRLTLVAAKPDDALTNRLILNLRFNAGAVDRVTELTIVGSESQIVGPVENNVYELELPEQPLTITVGAPDNLISSPTPASVTPIVFASVTPSPTPAQVPSATLPPGSQTALSFNLRFQGVTQLPKRESDRTLPVRFIIKNGQTGEDVETKTINLIANQPEENNYIIRWSGQGDFSQLRNLDRATVYIKGPKHIQKKICVPVPEETLAGTYRCGQGSITATDWQRIDFSKILILVGDLPAQDGVVNSYDISLVRNNLGKDDPETLRLADLNFDGIVDTQDYSLVIAALSIRTDEE